MNNISEILEFQASERKTKIKTELNFILNAMNM